MSDKGPSVLAEKGPVLLKFSAAWCAHCRNTAKTFAAVGKKLGGKVKTVVIDVEADEATADRFRIQSMPTFVALRDGAEKGRIVGAATQKALEALARKALEG